MYWDWHLSMYLKITPLLLLCFEMPAQTIRGKVLDHETGSAVASANVYFNASFQGTATDEDGYFALDISQHHGQGIVISCVGYASQVISNWHPRKFYKVLLTPQPTVLHELVIAGDDVPRKKKQKVFLREFLGSSANARKCTIENLDDLRLLYSKSSKTLKAFTEEPLIIYNKALGYRITYFLDEFKMEGELLRYRGYSRFEEDTTLSLKKLAQVKKRRREAYQGSRMHFFRALWSEQIQQAEFAIISQQDGGSLTYSDLIRAENDKVKYLLTNHPLRVSYTHRHSFINFYGDDKVPFTKNGYFHPEGLSWQGEMAKQRIGDRLPFEYQP